MIPGRDRVGDDALLSALSGQKYRSTEPAPKIVVNDQDVQPIMVQWMTDGGGCSECQACEDEGIVPLGHVFSIGVDAPPGHPHCACSLQDASDAEDYYGYIQSSRGYQSGVFELSSRY